jgi:hypothetical protein
MDNVFRFIQAGSEVSSLLGRVPSAVGYQPTLQKRWASSRSASPPRRRARSPPCRPCTCRPTTSPTRRRRRPSRTWTAPSCSRASSLRSASIRPSIRLNRARSAHAGHRRRGALPRREPSEAGAPALQGLQDIIAILGIEELSTRTRRSCIARARSSASSRSRSSWASVHRVEGSVRLARRDRARLQGDRRRQARRQAGERLLHEGRHQSKKESATRGRRFFNSSCCVSLLIFNGQHRDAGRKTKPAAKFDTVELAVITEIGFRTV